MIKVEKLEKYFNKGKSSENHVLNEVSLEMEGKGLVCILGESGSGKTTLLNTIGGLDTFQSGTISIEDTVLKKYEPKKIEKLRNQKFGYIFQNYYLLQDYTVAYNIKLALNMFDMTEEEKDERVDYVLDAMDMKKYKKKLVSQLSGGQQQRVSIARALVKSPDIILADEPTGNLDEENTLRIMGILKSISKECLVILVSHERNIAHFFADRIIEIQDGIIQKDYANECRESYEKMDDANIYLKDMEASRMEMKEAEVSVYQDKNNGGTGKIHLDLAWKDGKLYIQTPDDVTLVLAGEEAGCMMLDESRPKLDQGQAEEVSYDLPQAGTKKSSSLPAREIWKLACENIRMMGKKHKFIVGILLATSIMMVLVLADYMMQRSIDRKTVVTDDSHYVTVNLKLKKSIDQDNMDNELDEYISRHLKKGEYKDAAISSSCVLNFIYRGFTQLKRVNGRLKDYSVVSVKHLKKEDLTLGRMPENRNEIVIDQWLVDCFRKSGSVLAEVYRNEQTLLGLEVRSNITGMKLTVVGISDTNEPSIYIYDNVAIGFAYGGCNIISDKELKELYPGEYDDLKLADDEILLPKEKYKSYKQEKKWEDEYGNSVTLEAATTLGMKVCNVAGEFSDENGILYVVPQSVCDHLRLKYIKEGRAFKVYTDNPDETVRYFKETEKDCENLKINAVSTYQEQLAEYREKQKKVDINAGYLVTLAVSLLSVIIIYFTIKSNAMARSEELTVYRLIGIAPGSIIKAYMLEMILVTAYTCIPAILLTSGIIKFIVSIPSLQVYLFFPWWMALALTVSLLVVNSIISVLPVWGILRKPPAQLAAKS